MAKYLVTGGCGFIGSHLSEKLLNEGHQVRIIDDLSTGKLSNVDDRCEVIIGNVLNRELMHSLFEDINGCFHLAAIASVQMSNEEWLETHHVNQSATINVFEAARPRQVPVVYASSAAVYGDNIEMPLCEKASLRPLTAYGADKLGSELHARVASLSHGIPTTGMRFFNVYGPRQDPKSPYSGVISIFSEAILEGKDIKIFGDGKQTRDFVYVRDVVNFVYRAMLRVSKMPQVFNVCTGHSISINQLANNIMLLADQEVSVEYHPARVGDIQESLGDNALAARNLSITPSYSIYEGLKELLSWMEFQRDMENKEALIENEKALRLARF